MPEKYKKLQDITERSAQIDQLVDLLQQLEMFLELNGFLVIPSPGCRRPRGHAVETLLSFIRVQLCHKYQHNQAEDQMIC